MRMDSSTELRSATQEEIEEALGALTPAQLVQLEKSSQFRHRSLGPRGAGRNENDLLSDAVIAILRGRRKWFRENCTFMALLQGVMRSLASHIRAGKPVDAFDEIDPSLAGEPNNAEDFLEQLPIQGSVDPEQLLLARDLDKQARDLDKQIRERFADDFVVLLIYEALQDEMKPADIRSALDITENEYHAAAKRLRRAARSFVKGRSR